MLVLIKGSSNSRREQFARILAASFGAIYLNAKKIKLQLEESNSSNGVKINLIHTKMLFQIEKALQQERCVVVDDLFYKKATRAPYITLGQKYHQRMYWIELKPEQRINNKLDPFKDLNEPLEEEHLVLRSDKNGIREMINKVWTYLDTVKEYA